MYGFTALFEIRLLGTSRIRFEVCLSSLEVYHTKKRHSSDQILLAPVLMAAGEHDFGNGLIGKILLERTET